MAPLHSNHPLLLKLSLAFTALTTFYLLYSSFRGPAIPFVNMSTESQESIVHIVMFQYKPSVTESVKNDVSAAFMALKDACRLPDGSRYIISIDGGVNNSPEGLNQGMEHAFVVKLRNAAEREYYLDTDPAHQAFKASIPDKVAGLVVFDFPTGEFAKRVAGIKRRPSDEVHVRTV